MSGAGREEAPEPRLGFFLTLEGIEGSGKTTQASGLARTLEARGHRVAMTREPGGTPLAEALRHLLLGVEGESPVPEAELFMLLAARAQHLDRFIRPRLAQGEIVICDRFTDASLAYQGGGRGLGVARVAAANALATRGTCPDLTVIFDLPVDVALARVKRRGEAGGALTRLDRETRAFHQAVRDTYLALAAAEPLRIVVLAAQDAPERVAERLLAAVEPRLERRRAEGGLA